MYVSDGFNYFEMVVAAVEITLQFSLTHSRSLAKTYLICISLVSLVSRSWCVHEPTYVRSTRGTWISRKNTMWRCYVYMRMLDAFSPFDSTHPSKHNANTRDFTKKYVWGSVSVRVCVCVYALNSKRFSIFIYLIFDLWPNNCIYSAQSAIDVCILVVCNSVFTVHSYDWAFVVQIFCFLRFTISVKIENSIPEWMMCLFAQKWVWIPFTQQPMVSAFSILFIFYFYFLSTFVWLRKLI